MKKLLMLLLTWIPGYLFAQGIDCGVKPGSKPIIFPQKTIDSLRMTNMINAPYTIKIFVTIFADSDGYNVAASKENVLRQVQNMANQYQPQNICFILGGIRQVNNTDLNYQVDSTESAEVAPFQVSGFLNIFIHSALPGLNGTAYSIPGTYLSMSGAAVASLSNISTLGHEMGHCLGLYHTFSAWTEENGTVHKENVARSGACQNCATEGDVLCDTPADDDGGVDVNCTYVGGGKDACNVSYSPMTNNMMSYGYRPCRNTFTDGQGDRMRTFLGSDNSLFPLLVHDNIYIPVISGTTTISGGTGYTFARDIVYVSDGSPNLTVNGTANYQFQAKKVLIKSGTRFSPAAGGKVSVKSNPYCN